MTEKTRRVYRGEPLLGEGSPEGTQHNGCAPSCTDGVGYERLHPLSLQGGNIEDKPSSPSLLYCIFRFAFDFAHKSPSACVPLRIASTGESLGTLT
jgi:hypothetical protein